MIKVIEASRLRVNDHILQSPDSWMWVTRLEHKPGMTRVFLNYGGYYEDIHPTDSVIIDEARRPDSEPAKRARSKTGMQLFNEGLKAIYASSMS